jgi:predicted RNA binding protein YcfA (HicA-like mRNA interferase family)
MPKLPVLTPKKLLKKLNKIGFIKDHTTGSHVVMYHPQTKRRAVVPMHLKDIPKGTLSSLLKEAGVSKEDIVKK